MKKIDKKNFKYYLFENRFIFFLILSIIIIFISYLIISRFDILTFIVLPLIMLPTYLFNILLHLNNLNLLDSDYFWNIDIVGEYWATIFVVISVLCISLVFNLLTSKKKKIRKITLSSLLIFFIMSLLYMAFSIYNKYGGASGAIMGGSNLRTILNIISIIFTCFFILYLIDNKFNLKFIFTILIKFFFTVLEILQVQLFEQGTLHPFQI